MQKKVDFLVIGSGIAGLSFALKVAAKAKVCVICKTKIDETNTSFAQGGIASVTYEPDNFQKHIEDTLICGDGLCDPEIVKMVVEDAPYEINQLVEWGTQFDKGRDGKFDLAREGGHSEHRILHHKDQSGAEIQRALVARLSPGQEQGQWIGDLGLPSPSFRTRRFLRWRRTDFSRRATSESGARRPLRRTAPRRPCARRRAARPPGRPWSHAPPE